jgi:membrane peptidoglycan carboxypeptidase
LWAVAAAAVVGLFGGASIGAWYWKSVVADPGPEISRRHILGVIAEESPVYFRDGEARLGVFFQDEHRQQVDWSDLPPAWTAAIVASEDQRFWGHPGFDVAGLARAMWDNVRAGRVVAGGSTLSQQTAKNLFYRPDRSWRAKLDEALATLRLERHFDKSEILTFYANQFHVAGNGRGLGIAARHLFDKEPAELTTVECAFIAGLVKAPAAYDPFSVDASARQAVLQKAHDRTRYVLERLVEVPVEQLVGAPPEGTTAEAWRARRGAIVQAVEDAKAALANGYELSFSRGVFRFDSSAVLDEVSRRLAEPPFADALAAAGIEDPAKAGLKVITTLDRGAQQAAVYGLWHHLTEVGIMLEGKTTADLIRADVRPPHLDPGERVATWEFRYASIVGPVDAKGKRELDVDLGGQTCRVDRDGLVRIAAALHRGKVKSSTAKVQGTEVDALAAALPKDAVVWVSVRDGSKATPLCDLELRPALQGAVMVVENGEIRAMVGGNDNRNFNRATALRQFGSTWKTLVLQAALEFGWSPTDVLDNRRNVFPFSTTWYYPRADHTPVPEVSLAWAGVTSENIATIWLLYHLLDRMDEAQVTELATSLGLAPAERETPEAWRARLAKLGVGGGEDRVEESLFMAARHEVLANLDALGASGDRAALASLHFGHGFAAERARTTDPAKLDALDHQWLRLRALRERCGLSWGALSEAWSMGSPGDGGGDWFAQVAGDQVRVACGAQPEGFVSLAEVTPGTGALPAEGDVLVGGRLHARTLDAVASAMERRRSERELLGIEAPTADDPSVVYWTQDFRTLLALRYVRKLAQRHGVTTDIKEVLSMPLGASEITLEEAVRVYEGLVTGVSWAFPGRAAGVGGATEMPPPPTPSLLIQEIRDVEDRVIYRATPTPTKPVTPEVHAMTADILRNVVDWGTGKRGKGFVTLGGAPLPVGGKTGTTNDFKNAAFLGWAPVVDRGVVDPARSVIVGAYVGYDDNRPMVSGGIKLAGASGALPAWLHTVRGLAGVGLLGRTDVQAPTGGWKVLDPAATERVHVSETGGLPTDGSAPGADLLVRKKPVVAVDPTVLAAEAPDRPVRVAPSTRDAARLLDKGPVGLWESLKRVQEAPVVPKAPTPPPPARGPAPQLPVQEPEGNKPGRKAGNQEALDKREAAPPPE